MLKIISSPQYLKSFKYLDYKISKNRLSKLPLKIPAMRRESIHTPSNRIMAKIFKTKYENITGMAMLLGQRLEHLIKEKTKVNLCNDT